MNSTTSPGRGIARLATAAVAVLVLAACGSGSTDQADSTDDGPAAIAADTDTDTDAEADAIDPVVEIDDDLAATGDADADGNSDDDVDAGQGASDPADDDGFELPANIWPAEVDEPSSDDPSVEKLVVTRAADAAAGGVQPEGVDLVTARITSADGEVCEVCLWLADTDETRARGLMDVTDLGPAVGMAFSWDAATTGNFFMFNTPTPLSIAWFSEDGDHVGEADMEPCLVDDSARCERYGADAPYTLAVEMFGGQLDAVGIGPGATIALTDLSCT